ncbi:hypothetical protein [Urechidicola croceus]|uniref:hypothetical protein n=1 Tax=Urechidicola croceus TaxID=1850246 RepID=UPI0012EACD8C|nr:hypothetical protein [Urechidicola croceus]
MKKTAILLVFIFALAILSSCKSTKKGCGLTGDTNNPNINPIEQISVVETAIV